MLTRRQALAVCACAAAAPAIQRSAWAQAYPTRPIRLVVPFPPGGPTDITGRLVAQWLSEKLGTVVVENKGGAGGTVGTRAAAAADPDGYTLLLGGTSTLAINPVVFKDLNYDPVTSFTPVAMVSTSPFVLVVNPALPVHSVGDFIAYATANPGKVNFGSAGVGTTPHLTGELFKALAKVDIVHVPYKGGGPVIADLLGGQIQLTFELMTVLMPLIEAGELRPLAIATETRSADLPDVPTMAEAGVPGCLSSSWFGIVGPTGTPAVIVDKLNAEINNGLRSSDMIASFAKLGSQPKIGTPHEFAVLIASELERWGSLARKIGIAIN